MALGSAQPLTELSSERYRWPMRRADDLSTFMCRVPRNSGSLNHVEPEGLVQVCIWIVSPLTYIYAIVSRLYAKVNIHLSKTLHRNPTPFLTSI